MAAIGKLRTVEGNRLSFFCPGCKEMHMLKVKGPGDDRGWSFNGNYDKPTFQPSVLASSGHYTPDWKEGQGCWCKYYAEHPEEAERDGEDRFHCYRCHSYVTDGRIQYLDDTTHELRGQTVDLPVMTDDLT